MYPSQQQQFFNPNQYQQQQQQQQLSPPPVGGVASPVSPPMQPTQQLYNAGAQASAMPDYTQRAGMPSQMGMPSYAQQNGAAAPMPPQQQQPQQRVVPPPPMTGAVSPQPQQQAQYSPQYDAQAYQQYQQQQMQQQPHYAGYGAMPSAAGAVGGVPPQQYGAAPQQQQQQPAPYPDYEGAGYGYQQAPQAAMTQQQQQQYDQLTAQMQQMSLGPQQAQMAHEPEAIISASQPDFYPRPPSAEGFAFVEVPQVDVSPLFQRINARQQADFSKASCSSRFMRATSQSFPGTAEIQKKWQLPYGVIVQPFNDLGEEVPLVNAVKTGVQRCYKCRAYLNPFVAWVDPRRWTCNICKKVNEVPNAYAQQLDEFGCRVDIHQRPELRCGSVEYIAPQEYMARPPQPPCYLFVIDTSYNAIASGMLATVARTIRQSLDELTNEPRTRVGFVTVDSQLQYYVLKPGSTNPQILAVGEIQESLLPVPTDLLVTLSESRAVVESLLNKFESGKLFAGQQSPECALGAALTSAGRIMCRIGGKVITFLSTLASLGPHALTNREDMNAYGKDAAETKLLAEGIKDYKEMSLIYSRDQICCDLFICSPEQMFVDIASLSSMAKFTGGQVNYYPGFRSDVDGEKLKHDLYRVLTRHTGLEAVLRVRASEGVNVAAFHGNFFIRGHDLLALPNVDADKTYAIQLAHGGNLQSRTVCIQAAVLYTATNGERRIRVHTLLLPVAQSLAEMYRHVDAEATIALLAKMGVEEVPRSGITPVKNRIRDSTQEGLAIYGKDVSNNQMRNYHLVAPGTLKLFPLYSIALAKTDALLGGNEIRADIRTASLQRLAVESARNIILTIYPALFSVDAVEPSSEQQDGTAQQHAIQTLPRMVPLSQRYLSDDGLYVMCDSNIILVWIGKNIPVDELQPLQLAVTKLNSESKRNYWIERTMTPEQLQQVSEEAMASNEKSGADAVVGKESLLTTPLSRNLYRLCEKLRRRYGYQTVRSVVGNQIQERQFLRHLVEDRTIQNTMAYDEWITHLQKLCAKRL